MSVYVCMHVWKPNFACMPYPGKICGSAGGFSLSSFLVPFTHFFVVFHSTKTTSCMDHWGRLRDRGRAEGFGGAFRRGRRGEENAEGERGGEGFYSAKI